MSFLDWRDISLQCPLSNFLGRRGGRLRSRDPGKEVGLSCTSKQPKWRTKKNGSPSSLSQTKLFQVWSPLTLKNTSWNGNNAIARYKDYFALFICLKIMVPENFVFLRPFIISSISFFRGMILRTTVQMFSYDQLFQAYQKDKFVLVSCAGENLSQH